MCWSVSLRDHSQEFIVAELEGGSISAEIGDVVRGQILKGIIVIVSSFYSG